jgi:hypothetical protein
VQLDFLVAGADQVVDNVRRRRVAAGTAEPSAASQALDDAASVVDAAIGAWSNQSVSRSVRQSGRQPCMVLRTRMGGQLDLGVFSTHGRLAVSSAHGHAGHALDIVVVLFVIVCASPARELAAGQVAIEDAFVDIPRVDGGCRVGHQVVAHVGEGALHGGGGERCSWRRRPRVRWETGKFVGPDAKFRAGSSGRVGAVARAGNGSALATHTIASGKGVLVARVRLRAALASWFWVWRTKIVVRQCHTKLSGVGVSEREP